MAASFRQSAAPRDQKSCRFTASGNQTVAAAGTFTILDYDVATFNNSPSTYSNNGAGRVTVSEAGVYSITAGAILQSTLGALSTGSTGIFRNGELIAVTIDRATLAVGGSFGQNVATVIQLQAGDIIDCRASFTQVIPGVGQLLIVLLGILFGATATQVNHLGITKLEV